MKSIPVVLALLMAMVVGLPTAEARGRQPAVSVHYFEVGSVDRATCQKFARKAIEGAATKVTLAIVKEGNGVVRAEGPHETLVIRCLEVENGMIADVMLATNAGGQDPQEVTNQVMTRLSSQAVPQKPRRVSPSMAWHYKNLGSVDVKGCKRKANDAITKARKTLGAQVALGPANDHPHGVSARGTAQTLLIDCFKGSGGAFAEVVVASGDGTTPKVVLDAVVRELKESVRID